MTSSKMTKKNQNYGELVLPGLFILIAVIALWDTTNMMDSDSYVFPRAIAIAMIILNLLLIARKLLNLTNDKEQTRTVGASTFRRVALIIGMLISCMIMPYLGFLLSGIITFIFLMIISMYDEWTIKNKIIYPSTALITVIGFYLLFSKILLVPLPTGVFFD